MRAPKIPKLAACRPACRGAIRIRRRFFSCPTWCVILYEGNLHSFRQIFLNRDHPKDLNPTWWGDSVGKWEGDELVVDTIGFNGTHLARSGRPRDIG